MTTFTLHPGKLTLADIKTLLDENTQLALDAQCLPGITAAESVVKKVLETGTVTYGINTGFGLLANQRIAPEHLELLQRSLVLSHAVGVGKYLSDQAVRLILALKINSLARGHSGVRLEIIEALIRLFNAKVYPCIPEQGSVGASGDLAPLAHMSAILLGFGEARYQGKIISATQALEIVGMTPLNLAPKEGLALVNGTQVSTALAILGLFAAEHAFVTAIVAGAMSVDAAHGTTKAFDERIQVVRGHPEQIQVARWLRELLTDSSIMADDTNCHHIQDPYSLRCQPQVMGACLQQLTQNSKILLIEANAVTDNPLIFPEQNEILSGGNFHAEPVALAADAIANSIAEIGALSERRIALLIDTHFSGLPAFLVPEPGINSGFMMAQVTAAALASENKSLAHPASVDSIPTCANQEDHVSMATFAARRLSTMAENTLQIVGIELLAASEGIDLLQPLKTSPRLEKIHQLIRKDIAFYEKDRYFSSDITNINRLIQTKQICALSGIHIFD